MKSGGYITVTSTGVKATLNQIFLSVSTFAVFTIFQDGETEYVAMCSAYLSKTDLDAEDGDDWQNDEEDTAAAEAWKAWPKGAELAIFVVLLLYLTTVFLGLQGYMLQEDGLSESVAFICARAGVLVMFWACNLCSKRER